MGSLQKVDDLALHQIDRLIAMIEGLYCARSYGECEVLIGDEKQIYLVTHGGRQLLFAPTVDWRQGGPLFERNDISVEKSENGWRAHLHGTSAATGQTVLVAAMRARVKMTYGDEVGSDEP